MAKIETVFIPDGLNPIVELDPYLCSPLHTRKGGDIKQPSREKVGEIFQLSSDRFAFVCIHCSQEFLLLVQFTAHVERHLQEFYANEMKLTSIKDEPPEDTDVKPPELDECEMALLEAPSYVDSDSDKTASMNWWEFEQPERKNSSGSTYRAPSSYDCPECKRNFTRRSNLRRHLKVHSPPANEIYQCKLCDMKFTQQRYLRKHIRDKHRDMDYFHECTMCNEKFKYTYEYSQHMGAHQEEQCVMRRTKGTMQAECYRCHTIFDSLSICRQHLKTHYDSSLYCKNCQRFFTKEIYFRRHEMKCGSSTFDCDKCSATFKRHSILSKHRRTEHGTPRYYRPKPTEVRILSCDKCPQQFVDPSLFRRHVRAHKKESNIKPFKCHICGFEFLERGNLNRHLARHAGERDFTCKYCNKSFPKDYRSEHLRTHTGQKDHVCQMCGKQFISGGSLKRHMVCHSEERKFKCTMCPKSYSRSDKLLAHIRGHTGAYIYNCRLCVRGFGEKRGLKKHMLSAHGRPWTAEDDTTEIPKKPLYQPTASNETSEIKSELE